MNTWTSHQSFVDHTVHQCLQSGIRDRDKIIRQIQCGRLEERKWADPKTLTGLEGMDITQRHLIIAVSRSTSRKDKTGHRDMWCVPKVHRYVSLNRLRELTAAADAGNITAEEVVELGQSRDDLHTVALGLEAKARVMFTDAFKVRESAICAHCSVLDLGGMQSTIAPTHSGR